MSYGKNQEVKLLNLNSGQKMINKNLHKALLQKLNITRQAISQRAQKLKSQSPMTTADAVYVIAHQNGIALDKFLDLETIDRIRNLLPNTSNIASANAPSNRPPRQERKNGHRTIVIGKEFKTTDPILPDRILNDAKEMAGIYPLLYVLENSIREVINRVMTSAHGIGWWDTDAPRGLRDTVSKRMEDESVNSWHQRRGVHPIYYLDLNQLPPLVRKIRKKLVPSILQSSEWFEHFINEVYQSRCVLCHMNPLDKDSVQSVKLRLNQWQKLVTAKKDLIP